MVEIQFIGKCAKGCKPVKRASLVGWTLYCPKCETLAIENFKAKQRGEYLYSYNVKPTEITRRTREAVA